MSSPDHKVSANLKEQLDNGFFSPDLTTLEAFFKHLAGGNVVNPKIECHSAAIKFDKSATGDIIASRLEVAPKQSCAFVIQPVPPNFNEGQANAGSKLFVGAKKDERHRVDGSHQAGWLCIHDTIVFEKSKSAQGICPLKPSIYFSKSVRVFKDALRRLT